MALSKPSSTSLKGKSIKRKAEFVLCSSSEKERMSNETRLMNQCYSKKQKLSTKDSTDSSSASERLRFLIRYCIDHPSISSFFTYIKTIGSGSYGTVVQLKNKTDQKMYAMKLILLKDTNKEIEREIQMLSALNHEYVVRYHNSFDLRCDSLGIPKHISFDGKTVSLDKHKVLCIQMEFCNQTLQQLIKSKTLRKDKILRLNILRELCLGVKHIQNKQIMHRDLKPSNIFLDIHGHVKIGDFGFARYDFDESPEEKASVFSPELGTKFYKSPEIRKGRNDYSSKVDLYGLGVIALELYYPFQKENDRIRILTQLMKDGTFPVNFKSKSSASRNVEKIIKGLLKKDPEKRLSIEMALEMLSDETEENDNEEENYLSDTDANDENETHLQALYVISSREKLTSSVLTRRSLGFKVGKSCLITSLSKWHSHKIKGMRTVPSSQSNVETFNIMWSSKELDCAILKLRESEQISPFLVKDSNISKKRFKAFSLTEKNSVEMITQISLRTFKDDDDDEIIHFFDCDVKGLITGSPVFETTSAGNYVCGIVVGNCIVHGTNNYRVVLMKEIYECFSPVIQLFEKINIPKTTTFSSLRQVEFHNMHH